MKIEQRLQSLTFLIIGVMMLFCLTSCKDKMTAKPTDSNATATQVPATATTTAHPSSTPPRTSEHNRPELLPFNPGDEVMETDSTPTHRPKSIGMDISPADQEVPLATNGPWLLYQIDQDSKEWFIVNADGTGRMKIENPTGKPRPVIIPSKFSDYIAFRIRESDPDINSLYIMHIPDMEIVEIIDRISYPGLVESTAYNDSYMGTRMALYEDPVWSPDGRYLAFVGAIEGPSSDVYIYDTLDDEVRRLTSGEHHAVELMWSPNSQWIVHQEVAGFGAGCKEIATWAVSTNGEVALRLYKPCFDHLLTWLGPAQYMSYNHEMEGARDLRYVDLHHGQVTYLFEGSFFSINETFDPIHGTIVFVPVSSDPRTPFYESGIYVVSPAIPTPKLVSSELLIFDWDSNLKRIITKDIPCQEGFITALQMDGSLDCIQKSTFQGDLSWSPNGQWAISLKYGNELYNSDGEKVRRFVNYQVEEVIWRSDSVGTFLKYVGKLLYAEIPDGELLLVDDRNPGELSWIGLD